MHRASQCAQFALALGLPVAAFAPAPLVWLLATVFACSILRHLEDDQLTHRRRPPAGVTRCWRGGVT